MTCAIDDLAVAANQDAGSPLQLESRLSGRTASSGPATLPGADCRTAPSWARPMIIGRTRASWDYSTTLATAKSAAGIGV